VRSPCAAGRAGFTITLFLIGSGLRMPQFARMGWRPLAVGTLLDFALARDVI
jgi:hypothetical protein